jgi:UV DNA damage endonuclease
MRIGYACINNTLADKKIQVNRSMVKKTFLARGISYASELALKNITDLEHVIGWNIVNRVLFYRLSSDMFPWMSEYEFHELPAYNAIQEKLARIGRVAQENDMRLTFHPGPFNVLATANPDVLKRTIKELRQHAEIMDMLGMPRTPFAKINIHIGASYGDKLAALERFCKNAELLPEKVLKRLTVENDDKANMFSVFDLVFVTERTGIPIVFDYLHHKFCTGGLSEKEAFKLAVSTWKNGVTPVVHYSSSKRDHEDAAAVEAAHADMVYEPINTYGIDVDIMLEAKAKEWALLDYRKNFQLASAHSSS